MTNKLKNYFDTQQNLDNLGATLKKLYSDDTDMQVEGALSALTEKTFEILLHTESVFNTLIKDPDVIESAKSSGISSEVMAKEITDIMMISTLARQSLILEKLSEGTN